MRVFIFCAVLFTCLMPSAVSANEIVWKVEHPFRYLRYQSDLLIHEWAYKELQAENAEAARHAPISHIERKLNRKSWWTNKRRTDLAALRKIENRQTNSSLNVRHGWGSLLRTTQSGYVDRTCWNARTQKHSRCDESELLGTLGGKHAYLNPDYHRIIAHVEGDFPSGELCDWQSEDYVFLKPGETKEYSKLELMDCKAEVVLRIPYKPKNSSTIKVTVIRSNGEALQTSVSVKDYLVVGLGDSFSSGEGNPEIPAKMHPKRAVEVSSVRTFDDSDLDRRERVGVPRRSPANGSSAAQWTDRRCHRSIYSYQARAALQLAIAADENGDHHHAITFLHYACSGAEITEDTLYGSEVRECIGAAMRNSTKAYRHPFYMPQISKASIEICENGKTRENLLAENFRIEAGDVYVGQRRSSLKSPDCKIRRQSGRNFLQKPRMAYCKPENRIRKIDLAMTSIGGNDIGFSGIIADTIIKVTDSKLVNRIARIVGKDAFVEKKEAEKRLEGLDHRLKIYNAALEGFLGIKKPANNHRPLITMLYPNLIHTSDPENGSIRFCKQKEGDAIMDVSQFLSMDIGKLDDIDRLIEGRTDENGQKYRGLIDKIRAFASKPGVKWRLVDGHRKRFRAHGICATANNNPDETSRGAAEVQGIPLKIIDKSKKHPQNYSGDWLRFHPVDDHYPYETRKSWFRSPNQDYLNIQYYKGSMPKNWEEETGASAKFLAERIRGGSFHPTAEGHAHIADYVYCEAREALFGQACDEKAVAQHAHRW